MTASDILFNALHLDVEKQDRASQMRVTNLLKAIGWTTKRMVVHSKRLRFWFSPTFMKAGCPGCPDSTETEAAVAGQPDGQPLAQPSGQPPDSEPSTPDNRSVDNLDNLDDHSPKRSRSEDLSLCKSSESLEKPMDISEVQKGDPVVVMPGQAVLFRNGSQRLPKGAVSREFYGAKNIPLAAIEGAVFHELCDGGLVMGISHDGHRVKVRHQSTGRTSVFNRDGVKRIREATYANESRSTALSGGAR